MPKWRICMMDGWYIRSWEEEYVDAEVMLSPC